MDPIDRNSFLFDFAKASPSISCLILNHSGSPEKLQTNLTSIDLLCVGAAISDFITFCRMHPKTRQVRIADGFMRKSVDLEFSDGSEVKFFLIQNIFRKGLKSIAPEEFIRDSGINEYGMLVPSVSHHFEYVLLKYQFAGIEFPDRYQKYFSAMDPAVRTSIFRYLQAKYHFIFNTIEDLYKPKATARLKIMIGLRSRKENTLLQMFFRTVAYFWFMFLRLFFRKPKMYNVSGSEAAATKKTTDTTRQAAY